MLVGILQLLIGFALLTAGGHYLVEAATRIALLARITTAVVGLTIVALGTSLPELAVSLRAALQGSTDISYANVVGSNIFNVGMILAITAMIMPMPVGRQTFRLEYPFMLLASGVLLLLARDGVMDQLEGLFFIVSLAGFVYYTVRLARREVKAEEAEALRHEVERKAHTKGASGTWRKNLGLLGIGMIGLAIGADFMVRGAVVLAETLGVTERIIGLTAIAMGTSLPELATGIIAARRGESAIALGNIIGSNIFNILGILGTTALLVPVPVAPEALQIDNWVMLGFSAALYPLMMSGKRVSRLDGILLLSAFSFYMVFLFATL